MSSPEDQSRKTLRGVGPWAAVPAWVLRSKVSDRAVRLYAILALMTGATSDDLPFPHRKTLADQLNCSVPTIDRAIAEIIAVGALRVHHRYRKGTRELTSSEYEVVLAPPVDVSSRVIAPPPVGARAVTGEATVLSPVTQQEIEPINQNHLARCARDRIKGLALDLANAEVKRRVAAGQQIDSPNGLARIIACDDYAPLLDARLAADPTASDEELIADVLPTPDDVESAAIQVECSERACRSRCQRGVAHNDCYDWNESSWTTTTEVA